MFSTPVRVDKVGRFKRNFASTLHICGIDSSTVGLYECVISRTHGENITIWSGKIELLTDTAEGLYYMNSRLFSLGGTAYK